MSVPAIKICGLTRSADAAVAAQSGARYVGVIFAGGPRMIAPSAARIVFAAAGVATRIVVVGHEPVDDIVRNAMAAGADIIQLHGDPSARTVTDLRERWPGGIWAALRVPPQSFDAERAAALFAVADGVVLDAHAPGALGGTGVTIDWRGLVQSVRDVRALDESTALFVLAGGLAPENVNRAVSLLTPDVVDVSSGVEVSPGIKDHARVLRFISAARADSGDDEQLSLAGVQ
jgi:phosphoribosylanthranilate isomerase